jgi:hypothetical protein
MLKGCSHSDNSIMCFRCYLSGAENPNQAAALKEAQKEFAEMWQRAEARREQRRLRLEELKKQIPELDALDVVIR